MPELPEVETVVRELQAKVKGKTLSSVDPVFAKVFPPDSDSKKLQGLTISSVSRRAKYIIFNFSQEDLHLIAHLRMTGEFLFDQDGENNRFIRCIFHFTDRTVMYFCDMRKFGRLEICSDLAEYFKKMGIEPLGDDLTVAFLQKRLQSSRSIKALLLDQSLIAGIGNIYADEILFLSKINPQRSGLQITAKELLALKKNIKTVLQKAIDDTGITLPDYRERANKDFYYNVYGRAKQACKICGHKIEKIRLGGRGTNFCPVCQP